MGKKQGKKQRKKKRRVWVLFLKHLPLIDEKLGWGMCPPTTLKKLSQEGFPSWHVFSFFLFFCPSQNFGLIVIMSLWSWVPILLVLLNISCYLWADWKFQKNISDLPTSYN
jgi:hypothetical protein